MVQTRDLFKGNIEFVPQFAVFIQTNGIPELNSFDDGIAKRIRICNLPYKFVDNPVLSHEKQLDTTLKQKFDGDVRYAQQRMLLLLEYYKTSVKEVNKLHTPSEVMLKTNEYLRSQDAVGQFINEMFETSDCEEDKIKSSE